LKSLAYRWVDPPEMDIPADLLAACGGSPLLARALLQRDITNPADAAAFLHPEHLPTSPPTDFPDLDRLVNRLITAVNRRERIGVWGDFDVDGQTATSLLVSSLRRLGANVCWYIPVRGKESHGIALSALARFLEQGIQVLLTCDTGITAHDAVMEAARHGVDVLITDHHTPAETLPVAHAVVNPHRLPAEHPARTVCGVGMAYLVMQEVYTRLGRAGEMEAELDLVALGSIADVSTLTGDNRCLVQRGLSVLRSTRRPGLLAMCERAGLKPEELDETGIGFSLAPRLNALGRLADSNPAVDFLTTTDEDFASQFSLQLEGYNARRKLICDDVYHSAQAQIRGNPAVLNSPVLVLNHPGWEAGVVGIVASRLVEQYRRPVVMLVSPPDQPARGSARSVDGVNITTALDACRDLLAGYGGHAMAAGMSLDAANLTRFSRALAHAVSTQTPESPPLPELIIDAWVELEQINPDLLQTINRLAPFGAGNPAVTLACRNLTLKKTAYVDRAHEHLRLTVEDGHGTLRDIIWWQADPASLPAGNFDLAFRLSAGTYRGKRELRMELVSIRPLDGDAVQVEKPIGLEILDLRGEPDPQRALAQILHAEWLIWEEAVPADLRVGVNRLHLARNQTLVIFSSPPGQAELQAAMERVKPDRVILFGTITAPDGAELFLRQLGGMVRHAIKHGGVASINQLAAGLGHRSATVLKGLEWLASQGMITCKITEDQGEISQGGSKDEQNSARLEKELRLLIRETNAFREYYRQAVAEQLLMV